MSLQKQKVKKFFKYFLLILIIIIGGYIIFFGSTFAFNWKKISTENPLGYSPFLKLGSSVKPGDLRGEGDSRINILLLGKSGELTDTIQVVSINPDDKTVAMVSIPRDLRVKIDKSYMKINAVYEQKGLKNFEAGITQIEDTVSGLLDLKIHYFVMADFQGFTKLVDAVGGVDVNVENKFTDYTYPVDVCNEDKPETCQVMTVSFNAGEQHMDGKRALIFVRSRHSADNNEGTDFARGRRQQLIMVELKQKILSLGTLANPTKINELINLAGKHVRTDLSLENIQSLAKLAKDIDSSKMNSLVLDYSNVLAPTETSDIMPKNNDYSVISDYVHSFIADPYIIKENAKVSIKNGTGQDALAKKLEAQLKSYGYNIISVDKIDVTEKTVIYDYSNSKKEFTLNFLSQRLKTNVTIKKTKSSADIEIILGKNYKFSEGT
ncbi:MAG: LCP family protein [Patescibacteria group bacterium]